MMKYFRTERKHLFYIQLQFRYPNMPLVIFDCDGVLVDSEPI